MSSDDGQPDIDPRRAMWRRGSYEIAGDWVAPASLSVLDRLVEVAGAPLRGRRLLDVATGTGTVAIEAALRGADVVGVDLTDELVEVARRRADDVGATVRFEVGDFDRLDAVLGDSPFDVITSSFGVIFAPEPSATLAGLERRLPAGGLIGVTGWDPASVFIVPEPLLDLLPERPAMPDMGAWTTGIAELCSGSACAVESAHADDLVIEFESVADSAEQLERWSGGWAQLLETFDALGVGDEARARLREHLASYSTPTGDGIGLRATYHTSVLRRTHGDSHHDERRA